MCALKEKIWLFILICLFAKPPLSAGKVNFGPGKSDNFLANLQDDFQNILTAPVHIETQDLYFLLPVSGITTALFVKDKNIRNWVQDRKNDKVENTLGVIEYLGDGRVGLCFSGLLWALGGRKERSVGQQSVEAFVETGMVTQAIKCLSGRVRPRYSDGDPYKFKGPNFFQYPSFPSGHTSTAFAFAAVWGEEYGLEWLTYSLATLVGISRIYRDAHWASDVFVGAILGTLIGRLNVIPYDKQSSNPALSLGYPLFVVSYKF